MINDDAVPRQAAYLRRHPDVTFPRPTETDPMSRAVLPGGVEVTASTLRRLLNRLEMGDPAWLLLPWRAATRNVYAVSGDGPGGGGALIAVMDNAEQAEGACADHHAVLAERNGHTGPVHPAAAASKAGI